MVTVMFRNILHRYQNQKPHSFKFFLPVLFCCVCSGTSESFCVTPVKPVWPRKKKHFCYSVAHISYDSKLPSANQSSKATNLCLSYNIIKVISARWGTKTNTFLLKLWRGLRSNPLLTILKVEFFYQLNERETWKRITCSPFNHFVETRLL